MRPARRPTCGTEKRSERQTGVVKIAVSEGVGQATKELTLRDPEGDQGGDLGQAGAKVEN